MALRYFFRPGGIILLALMPTLAFAAPIKTSLTLKDVHGKEQYPLTASGKTASVFFFIAHDCPISNQYAPEMNRIYTDYVNKKIMFYVVYTDTDVPLATLRQHARAFAYRCPALSDTKQELARSLGITTTPEVAVIAPGGKRLYRGRIDDTYARVGVRRNQTTRQDLRDALDAILKKQPVPHPTTTAVGCYLSPTH